MSGLPLFLPKTIRRKVGKVAVNITRRSLSKGKELLSDIKKYGIYRTSKNEMKKIEESFNKVFLEIKKKYDKVYHNLIGREFEEVNKDKNLTEIKDYIENDEELQKMLEDFHKEMFNKLNANPLTFTFLLRMAIQHERTILELFKMNFKHLDRDKPREDGPNDLDDFNKSMRYKNNRTLTTMRFVLDILCDNYPSFQEYSSYETNYSIHDVENGKPGSEHYKTALDSFHNVISHGFNIHYAAVDREFRNLPPFPEPKDVKRKRGITEELPKVDEEASTKLKEASKKRREGIKSYFEKHAPQYYEQMKSENMSVDNQQDETRSRSNSLPKPTKKRPTKKKTAPRKEPSPERNPPRVTRHSALLHQYSTMNREPGEVRSPSTGQNEFGREGD